MSTDRNDVREQQFPLCETIQHVFQQGASRARELTDRQHTLHTLQASLSDNERRCEAVISDLQQTDRTISRLSCDIQQVQRNIISLETQTQNILLENLELRNSIEEQSENFHSLLAGYGQYRSTTEEFREAVTLLERQTDEYKELQEKEQQVSKLREELEELKVDLQNPEGGSVRQTQKEIDILKTNIHNVRQTVRVRKAHMERERDGHSQLRREIEIQHRRCEAIIRRLHCQLKKAQTNHRQLCSDITLMETEVSHLKTQLSSDV